MWFSIFMCVLVCVVASVYFSYDKENEIIRNSIIFSIVAGGLYGFLVVPEITLISYSLPLLIIFACIPAIFSEKSFSKNQDSVIVYSFLAIFIIGICHIATVFNKNEFYISDSDQVAQELKVDEDLAEKSVEIFLNGTRELYKRYTISGDACLQKLNTTIFVLDSDEEEKELIFKNEYYWLVLLENTEKGLFDFSSYNGYAYALVSAQDERKVLWVSGLYDPTTKRKSFFEAYGISFFNSYRTYLYFKNDDRYANNNQNDKTLKIDKEGNLFLVATKVENLNDFVSVLTLNFQDGKISEYYTNNLPDWIADIDKTAVAKK